MANHYRISPKFWLKARQRGWTDAQTTLALFLLTCEHRNLEGLYRLPRAYMASDLGWPARKVDEALTAVISSGLVAYDEAAEVVLIPKALKHQRPGTDNHLTGAISQLERLPRTCLWHDFVMACECHCPRLAERIAIRWPSDTDGISHAREDARGEASSSSSISLSSSKTPQPPQSGGAGGLGNGVPPKNSRAHGTNPRSLARLALADESAQRASLAIAGLVEPDDEHRGEWERLHTALIAAVTGIAEAYVIDFALVAVDGGTLVIGGPEAAWLWGTQRFGRPLTTVTESMGIPARFATADEFEGLRSTGEAA